MHCLRHILMYSILIPMPSASPFFLLIFTIAAYWAIRPCGYCMTILAILFFSTSPSSPFLAVLSDSPAPPPPATSTPVAYDMNIPERGAFFLNGGNIFDPVLVGYREMQRVWRETLEGQEGKESSSVMSSSSSSTSSSLDSSVSSTTQDASNASVPEVDADLSADSAPPVAIHETGATTTSAATGSSSNGLPPGYVDLRIGGIGLVLDLGWRRTDEGLRWEVENVRQAAEAKRTRRVMRERRRKSDPSHSQAHAIPVAAPVPGSGDKGESAWLRTPFVGLW